MTFSEAKESLVAALLRPINPAVVVLLGFYTVVWGFWLANPFWEVFTSAQVYSALETSWIAQVLPIPPEVLWGSIAIICGIIICYGAMRRTYHPLMVGATIACVHWLTIGIMYLMGDWMNTGGITSLMFAIYGAFLWVNVKVNFKDNHDMDDVLR